MRPPQRAHSKTSKKLFSSILPTNSSGAGFCAFLLHFRSRWSEPAFLPDSLDVPRSMPFQFRRAVWSFSFPHLNNANNPIITAHSPADAFEVSDE